MGIRRLTGPVGGRNGPVLVRFVTDPTALARFGWPGAGYQRLCNYAAKRGSIEVARQGSRSEGPTPNRDDVLRGRGARASDARGSASRERGIAQGLRGVASVGDATAPIGTLPAPSWDAIAPVHSLEQEVQCLEQDVHSLQQDVQCLQQVVQSLYRKVH